MQVRIQAPQGMPITRPAEKGKSRIPVRRELSDQARRDQRRRRLFAADEQQSGEVRGQDPACRRTGSLRGAFGVKLEGPFEDVGPIPGTTATAYTLKGREYAITVSGTGSLRASAQNSGDGEGETGPPIDARKPLIYERLPWVLSLTFAMLAVGFAMLWRRTAPVRPGGKR